jgi:hypothetical protein
MGHLAPPMAFVIRAGLTGRKVVTGWTELSPGTMVWYDYFTDDTSLIFHTNSHSQGTHAQLEALINAVLLEIGKDRGIDNIRIASPSKLRRRDRRGDVSHRMSKS